MADKESQNLNNPQEESEQVSQEHDTNKGSDKFGTPKRGPKRAIKELLVFLRDRLSLENDKADPEETIAYIKKGVEFEGTNIWILVFAIMVASIGLSVNSAAVIIGAMLISPLMGPIMGIGMGVGINDFDLIKKAAKNLSLMVAVSVVTSTLYFFISPIGNAQSELLARTQPTLWDVLIALFGGLAGIVAGSRREKSNAIPGVAIATALMPPLCTAGYGIATGNMAYFAGAFYLFTINSVFISVSTFLIVRYLKYPKKTFINPEREKVVKRWIGIIVLVITLPSTYIAFKLVKNTVFEREAGIFITENFVFDNCQVISKNINLDGEFPQIEIALIGEHIADERVNDLKNKLKSNDLLKDAELIVRQGGIIEQGLNVSEVQRLNQEMKAGIIEDLYRKNDEALLSKEQQIRALENELFKLKKGQVEVASIKQEIMAINENVQEYTLMRNPFVNIKNNQIDTLTFAYVRFKKRPQRSETKKLEKWFKARTQSDSLKLVVEY